LSQSTTNPLQQLGEAIRLKRQFKTMTLLDNSISIGVHQTTIGRLEQGYPAISIGILYQVLKILGSAENINKLAGDLHDSTAQRQWTIKTTT
jgi:transcriptional regulator with XRE-family HTH domain